MPDETPDLPPLTDDEVTVFSHLCHWALFGGYKLVRSSLDGEPVAVIAFVEEIHPPPEDGRNYKITPTAVLITDTIMSRLVDPGEHAPPPMAPGVEGFVVIATPELAQTQDHPHEHVHIPFDVVKEEKDGE